MTLHVRSRHSIRVAAPADIAFMFFTPAGEELWVDGWQPVYVHPADGRTCAGMVFTTGSGTHFTIWQLADFDREARRSRYVRTTPALRTGFVTVHCQALDDQHTEVHVGYELTALNAEGEASLGAYEGTAFVAMIDEWATLIAARLPELLRATIR
jgi:hypothetical protein